MKESEKDISGRAASWGKSFAAIGLVAGLVYSISGLIVDVSKDEVEFGTLLAFLSIIVIPILFAAIGAFIGTLRDEFSKTGSKKN